MNDELQQIEELLDKKVRPDLAKHGGNIAIKSFENNILRVKLLGSCSSCPSANGTNEEFIKVEVLSAFPEIKDVQLVNDVSAELLDFARKLLSKE